MMTPKVAVIAPRDEAQQNQAYATKQPQSIQPHERTQHRYRHSISGQASTRTLSLRRSPRRAMMATFASVANR